MSLPVSVPAQLPISPGSSDGVRMEQFIDSTSGMRVLPLFGFRQKEHTGEESSLFVVSQPLDISSPNLGCTPTAGCDESRAPIKELKKEGPEPQKEPSQNLNPISTGGCDPYGGVQTAAQFF